MECRLSILIEAFFDNKSNTFCYVIIEDATRKAAVIDSVLGYDQFSGKTNTQFVDSVIAFVKQENLDVEWILDTHIHADHITAAHYLRQSVGGKIAIGARITEVLKLWKPIFNVDLPLDGSQFDRLLLDNETIQLGTTGIKVLYTPGHTPACVSYLIEDAVFVGDTVFMPDIGTARTDFPGGSAGDMYESIMRILELPESTRIFACHDYPPSKRPINYLSTVSQQRQHNIMLQGSKSDYIALRDARDEGKSVPKMLLPAIQTNLRAGAFDKPEENFVQYIKIPVDRI